MRDDSTLRSTRTLAEEISLIKMSRGTLYFCVIAPFLDSHFSHRILYDGALSQFLHELHRVCVTSLQGKQCHRAVCTRRETCVHTPRRRQRRVELLLIGFIQVKMIPVGLTVKLRDADRISVK
jgi:hypothetical protein